ncbi:MAG: hypothetical protein ABI333_13530 [bacterium]
MLRSDRLDLRWILALVGGLACLGVGGCKKKPVRPKELKSLSKDKACRAFFERVRSCSSFIDGLKADKLKLSGAKRESYLKKLKIRSARAFRDIPTLCRYITRKLTEQLDQLDTCYRQAECPAFASCFVEIAFDEVGKRKGFRDPALDPQPRPRPAHMHRH